MVFVNFDHRPSLAFGELAKLEQLILGVLPLVPRAHPAIKRDSHCTYNLRTGTRFWVPKTLVFRTGEVTVCKLLILGEEQLQFFQPFLGRREWHPKGLSEKRSGQIGRGVLESCSWEPQPLKLFTERRLSSSSELSKSGTSESIPSALGSDYALSGTLHRWSRASVRSDC